MDDKSNNKYTRANNYNFPSGPNHFPISFFFATYSPKLQSPHTLFPCVINAVKKMDKNVLTQKAIEAKTLVAKLVSAKSLHFTCNAKPWATNPCLDHIHFALRNSSTAASLNPQ